MTKNCAPTKKKRVSFKTMKTRNSGWKGKGPYVRPYIPGYIPAGMQDVYLRAIESAIPGTPSRRFVRSNSFGNSISPMERGRARPRSGSHGDKVAQILFPERRGAAAIPLHEVQRVAEGWLNRLPNRNRVLKTIGAGIATALTGLTAYGMQKYGRSKPLPVPMTALANVNYNNSRYEQRKDLRSHRVYQPAMNMKHFVGFNRHKPIIGGAGLVSRGTPLIGEKVYSRSYSLLDPSKVPYRRRVNMLNGGIYHKGKTILDTLN
nr:MAG: hypothetical protein [Cressdnaviricota sp.]